MSVPKSWRHDDTFLCQFFTFNWKFQSSLEILCSLLLIRIPILVIFNMWKNILHRNQLRQKEIWDSCWNKIHLRSHRRTPPLARRRRFHSFIHNFLCASHAMLRKRRRRRQTYSNCIFVVAASLSLAHVVSTSTDFIFHTTHNINYRNLSNVAMTSDVSDDIALWNWLICVEIAEKTSTHSPHHYLVSGAAMLCMLRDKNCKNKWRHFKVGY